jgi:hypothetical protein
LQDGDASSSDDDDQSMEERDFGHASSMKQHAHNKFSAACPAPPPHPFLVLIPTSNAGW